MGHRSVVQAHRGSHRVGYPAGLLALVLFFLSACSGQLPPVLSSTPTAEVRAPGAPSTTTGTVVPAPAIAFSPDLLALPSAFRYELTLQPMQADAAATVIAGQYRNGAWAQSSRSGGQPAEELVVARDPTTTRLNSYTRAAGDAIWTRWPGVTFDGAYGPASPFTILRLRPLATRTAAAESTAETDGTTADGETKTQALFSTEVVQRILTAGVLAIAENEDTRAALEQQIAPFFIPQTITYWTDGSGKITRAAATLLSLGPGNTPAPWVEITASYSAYDDPAIAVAAPANATNIADVAGKETAAEQASDVQPGVTLRVRVFSSPGVPATDSVVTAYPPGKKTVVAEKLGPDAQFAVKPGQYDVLVRSGGAQQWLKGVVVTTGAVASNDVLFDFATLIVKVNLNGAAPAVDVVVYPAGEKTDFAGFISENPAHFRLPVGLYDVEAATQDGSARKRIANVEVRAGLETTLDIDLGRP